MLTNFEFKKLLVPFFYIVLFVLFLPIINSPIHGDDLVAPFNYYFKFNGSIFEYISNISLAFDGHINFLGEIVSALWLDLLISLLVNFDSMDLYDYGYRITKLFVVLIFVLIAAKMNNRISQKLSTNSLLLYTLLSFLVVTVYHTNWSSDPVGNYPLTGYVSASMAGLYILLLRCKTFKNKFGYHFLFITLAILYYELNIALLAVMIYHFRRKINGPKSILIILATIIFSTYLYIFLTPQNAYDGGKISFNLFIFRSFILQLVSPFPPTTFPLAVYFSQAALVSSLIFLCALLILIMNMRVFSKTHELLSGRLNYNLKFLSINENEKMLLIYFVSSCFILSISKKYQAEIIYPGQVYMSFSSGQLLFIVFMTRILITHSFSSSARKTFLVALLAISISFQNYLMVSKLHERTKYTQALLYAWEKKESERCLALENFNTYRLGELYMKELKQSLSKVYYDKKKFNFCNERTLNGKF